MEEVTGRRLGNYSLSVTTLVWLLLAVRALYKGKEGHTCVTVVFCSNFDIDVKCKHIASWLKVHTKGRLFIVLLDDSPYNKLQYKSPST